MGEISGSGIMDDGFAGRFAGLLIRTRREAKCSCRTLAQRSGGRFGVATLHSFERGDHVLTEELVVAISELYGAELESILDGRPEVRISDGVIRVGDAMSTFTEGDPTSMLSTYLRLVRSLRNQQRVLAVELRRDDVERLAEHIHVSGEAVVDQLAELMRATRAQHRSMVGLFASGALVIAVVASLAASGTALASSARPAPAETVTSQVTAPWLMLPSDAVFARSAVRTPAPIVVHARAASRRRKPKPAAATPTPTIQTGIDDTGALVATDLGTGNDKLVVPSTPTTSIQTGIDDSGALVATDLGTGDGKLVVPRRDRTEASPQTDAAG